MKLSDIWWAYCAVQCSVPWFLLSKNTERRSTIARKLGPLKKFRTYMGSLSYIGQISGFSPQFFLWLCILWTSDDASHHLISLDERHRSQKSRISRTKLQWKYSPFFLFKTVSGKSSRHYTHWFCTKLLKKIPKIYDLLNFSSFLNLPRRR